ncbi:MAG: hypothetical protein ACOYOU_19480, partial [Kiritimatiellia bacterium]
VDYCVEQGFKMMALFPESQQWSLRNIAARQVLRRLGEVQLPVMVEAGKECDATDVLNALDGLDMSVILLNVSLTTLTEAMLVLKERPKTFLATRQLCGGDTIEILVQSLGPDRLIFTSGFPISCFSAAFLTAKFAGISNPERDAILGGNMASILGL